MGFLGGVHGDVEEELDEVEEQLEQAMQTLVAKRKIAPETSLEDLSDSRLVGRLVNMVSSKLVSMKGQEARLAVWQKLAELEELTLSKKD